MYDDKLQFLSRINQEVMLEPLFKNEHIIHLNLEPLAHTVRETAESWISSLGSLLNKPTKEDLFNLRDELTVLNHTTLSIYFYSKYPLIFICDDLSLCLFETTATVYEAETEP